jgi:hypothetical protein
MTTRSATHCPLAIKIAYINGWMASNGTGICTLGVLVVSTSVWYLRRVTAGNAHCFSFAFSLLTKVL